MKIASGSISGVSNSSWQKSDAIQIPTHRQDSIAYLWVSIEGDTGQTGASIQVHWEGCYKESGTTYGAPDTETKLVSSGTSVTGMDSNGVHIAKFNPVFPWIKVRASGESAASTSAVTVRWALCMFD